MGRGSQRYPGRFPKPELGALHDRPQNRSCTETSDQSWDLRILRLSCEGKFFSSKEHLSDSPPGCTSSVRKSSRMLESCLVIWWFEGHLILPRSTSPMPVSRAPREVFQMALELGIVNIRAINEIYGLAVKLKGLRRTEPDAVVRG